MGRGRHHAPAVAAHHAHNAGSLPHHEAKAERVARHAEDPGAALASLFG